MAYDESYEQYLKAWNQKQSLRGRSEPRAICEVCEEREALVGTKLKFTDTARPFPICQACLDNRPTESTIIIKEH